MLIATLAFVLSSVEGKDDIAWPKLHSIVALRGSYLMPAIICVKYGKAEIDKMSIPEQYQNRLTGALGEIFENYKNKSTKSTTN